MISNRRKKKVTCDPVIFHRQQVESDFLMRETNISMQQKPSPLVPDQQWNNTSHVHTPYTHTWANIPATS